MKMRNRILAAICGFFLFAGMTACGGSSNRDVTVSVKPTETSLVRKAANSESQYAVTKSMVYDNIRIQASDSSTAYRYSDLKQSKDEGSQKIIDVPRSGTLTVWLTNEVAMTKDDGTELKYSDIYTLDFDVPQYFSTDMKYTYKKSIRCTISTSSDQDGLTGTVSLDIGFNSSHIDDIVDQDGNFMAESIIETPTISYNIKALSFGEKLINSRIVQWTIPLAVIGLILLAVMKSAVKIYRLGLESRTDYMTKEDGEKFKAETRQEMKEAKKDLSTDILEICIRDIHKEMKPLKEVQSMAETIKTDRQVMDVKLNAIEEKYEEIRKLSDEVKLLNTRVNNLQYGQNETAEGTRRSGK